MKRCRGCGEEKPLDEFGAFAVRCRGGSRLQARPTCKTCASQTRRQRYASDDLFRAHQITHSQNSRARQRGLPAVEVGQVLSVLARLKCEYCGQVNDGTVPMHLDHRVPLSRGGDHVLANLALACEFCNLAKRHRDEAEFRDWLWGAAWRLLGVHS